MRNTVAIVVLPYLKSSTMAVSSRYLYRKAGNNPVMNEDLEQQVIDLQARVAFQEDTLQALDHAMAEQDKVIALLQLQLRRWESRFEGMTHAIESSGIPVVEKPPHY